MNLRSYFFGYLFKPQIECWRFRPPKKSKCEELFLKRKESCDDKFGSLSQFGEIPHKRIWLVKGLGGEGRAGRCGYKFWPAREDRTVRKRKAPKAKKVKETKRALELKGQWALTLGKENIKRKRWRHKDTTIPVFTRLYLYGSHQQLLTRWRHGPKAVKESNFGWITTTTPRNFTPPQHPSVKVGLVTFVHLLSLYFTP